MPTTSPIPNLKLTDGERRFYQSEGYLQIPGLMSERDAGDLRAEVMDLMQSIGGFEGNKLKQSWEYKTGSHIDRLINSRQLCDLAGQLMGGESTLYLPFTAVKGVGGGTFHFHQDNNYTLFDDGMRGINMWIALMPMTPENGCLMVVPRSHKSGTLESVLSPDGDAHKKVKYDPADFLPVRMRAGDCIAFSRLTVHGSGRNETTGPRVAYAIQYHRNDASWIDKETGEKKLLTQFPRWTNKPVEHYSVPAGKRDGHSLPDLSMRKSLLIVAVVVISVIVSYFLWRDRLERGQIAITPSPTTRPASRLSPEIAKALDRRLPEDFSCAGGLQKTLHRMGDETRTQIFLDLFLFRQHGVREDMPIRAKLGGKTLREALKIVQAQSDPPLACDTAGEIVLIGPPQFEWKLWYSLPNCDVHLLASTPAEEQQLIADIQRHMASCPWLAPARPERWPMMISKGTLTTGEDRVLPRYELMRYLNRRHARLAIWDFAGHAGLLFAGSLALLGVIQFVRWRRRARRRRRDGLCRRCGYDLRASIERCPECGLAFG